MSFRLRPRFPLLLAGFVFLLSLTSVSRSGAAPRAQGAVTCVLQMASAQGELTVSLYNLLGDKMYEKKVALDPRRESQTVFLFGVRPGGTYVVEVEGKLVAADGGTRAYSRASKATVGASGSKVVVFGDGSPEGAEYTSVQE